MTIPVADAATLVTGATDRLGRAVAHCFALRDPTLPKCARIRHLLRRITAHEPGHPLQEQRKSLLPYHSAEGCRLPLKSNHRGLL
jgi:hypothetical protein